MPSLWLVLNLRPLTPLNPQRRLLVGSRARQLVSDLCQFSRVRSIGFALAFAARRTACTDKTAQGTCVPIQPHPSHHAYIFLKFAFNWVQCPKRFPKVKPLTGLTVGILCASRKAGRAGVGGHGSTPAGAV